MSNTLGYDGVKFFEPSFADSGATIVVSSNDASKANIVDSNQEKVWVSSGSDDVTTETIDITLSATQSITRIFVFNINWKDFKIKYDGGTDFAGVNSLDASGATKIDITNYTRDMAYFEFDSVSTDEINLEIFNTQSANEEKQLGYIVICTETGTLSSSGIGRVAWSFNNNSDIVKTLNKKSFVQKQQRTARGSLELPNIRSQADYDLVYELSQRVNPFLVWSCGGLLPADFLIGSIEGYRLQDLIKCQVNANFEPTFATTFYKNSIAAQINFIEVN
jgi:hypothetical protein